MNAWLDGQPATQLSLLDRGLAYGDGLFETIKVLEGRPTLLNYHLERLTQGAARLKLRVDQHLLEAELQAFCAVLGQGVVKLIVTRGDGLRGYAAPVTSARRILLASATPAYPQANAEQGVALFDCQTRLAEQPLLAGLKHLNRLEQVLARSEWESADYAEGLLRDYSGRIIEGVFSNLLLVKDGALLVPDVSRCGVAGVMRAALIEHAQTQGINVRIGDYRLVDLRAADEVFLCNSLYGIWPVRQALGCHWPVGALTRTLQLFARSLLEA